MTDRTAAASGATAWADLTVADVDGVRDFYAAVAGWAPQPLSMGDYADYVTTAPATGGAVAGICHARGANAGLPPVWLVYSRAGGGAVLAGPKPAGGGARYAVIRDPAGAVAALHQAAP